MSAEPTPRSDCGHEPLHTEIHPPIVALLHASAPVMQDKKPGCSELGFAGSCKSGGGVQGEATCGP